MRIGGCLPTRVVLLIVLLTLAGLLGATCGRAMGASPRSPAESQAALKLADPELVVELVAAEPDVVSPVAIAWDAAGRLFVAEMRDYPLGPGSGRITRLVDADGDGHYERTGVFAEGLAFPNSVLPWRDGLLVTAAPDLWFLRDADGDGRADERRVLWTGFGEGNQQLRANGLTWGLDHWVYGANGRSDGSVRPPDQPEAQAVSIRQRDFRFHPALGRFEAIAGGSQFGLARDDWGERFPSWNTNPLRHVVRDALRDDTGREAAGDVNASLAAGDDWGPLYPAAPRPETFNREPVDRFNASCGPTIYRDELLGAEYRGNAFVCEPLTSLVQRRALVPAGVTFVAERRERETELLASTDPWFHPVNLTTGPDGALYVVDFYRRWVEHPLYVPESLRNSADWREGAQHGRIWRVRRRDRPPRTPATWPAAAGTAQLVDLLGHPGAWWRDTAARLLIERGDRAAIGPLKDSLRAAPSPLARLHALYALDALGALDAHSLVLSLHDSAAGVRRHAVRLARARAAAEPALAAALPALADDPEVTVRFELAQAAAALPAEVRLPLVAKLAARDGADRWVQSALVAVIGSQAVACVKYGLGERRAAIPPPLLEELAARIGQTEDDSQATACLGALAEPGVGGPSARMAVLAGVATGLERRGQSLARWLADPPAEFSPARASLRQLFEQARALAAGTAETHERLQAVAVLAHDPSAEAGPILLSLLEPRIPPTLQWAAAKSLGLRALPAELDSLVARYSECTVATRREIVLALLRRPAGAAALVEAVEAGGVPAAELDSSAREALSRSPDPALVPRVKELFASQTPADRQEVLERYQAVLTMPGDVRRGGAAFAARCLGCHRGAGRGQQVGPDLSGIAGRPKQALLEDILAPSRQIAGDQQCYTLVTAGGQVLVGLLAGETGEAVTLRRAEGLEDVVPRASISELRATGRSLMPDGFEEQIPPAEMADLLAFLAAPQAERALGLEAFPSGH